jgi:hypothetical protein
MVEYLQRQAEEQQQAVEVADKEHVPVVQQSWPERPIDTSFLTKYGEHVARYILFGEVTN